MSFSSGFGGMNPNAGMDVGMGYRDLAGQNPVAEQTQQMANNPIYGQGSPFQPPMPNADMNPNVSKGFGPAPIDTNMSFGKNMGSAAFLPMFYKVNSMVNDVFGNQTPNTANQSPTPQGNILGNSLANSASQLPNQAVNESFQGGLRPAPANYRPPMRSGGILRRRMR